VGSIIKRNIAKEIMIFTTPPVPLITPFPSQKDRIPLTSDIVDWLIG
jgi:hypothetical protein